MIKFKPTSEQIEDVHEINGYNFSDQELDAFKNITQLAAKICGVEFSLINFLDEEKQYTKACFGIDIVEVPIEVSFCTYSMLEKDELVVSNTSKDIRYQENPFVVGPPYIRFYAGINIVGKNNQNIGTLCVLGCKPKELSSFERESLYTLANEVSSRLELMIKDKEVKRATKFLKNSTDLMFVLNNQLNIEYVNDEIEHLFHYSKQEVIGSSISILKPEEQMLDALMKLKDDSTHPKYVAEGKYFTKHNKELFLEVSASYIDSKLYVTAKDISNKQAIKNELRKEQLFKHKILETIDTGIVAIDNNENPSFFNNVARKLLGKTKFDELDFKNFKLFEVDIDGNRKEIINVNSAIKSVLNGDMIVNQEVIYNGNKNDNYLLLNTRPIVDSQHMVIGAVIALQDITEQKISQVKLKELVNQKETLLAEIHHRVKNNLAVISGLLYLQLINVEDESAKKALLSSQLRILSMAKIHESMYESDNFAHIDYSKFLEKLIVNLKTTLTDYDDKIKIILDVEKISLNIKIALPISLIINELITNAYKYAFPGENRGTITVRFFKKSDSILTVHVFDNGIGLPTGLDISRSTTLGFVLIRNLISQLNAEITVNSKSGLFFELNIPYDEEEEFLVAEDHLSSNIVIEG